MNKMLADHRENTQEREHYVRKNNKRIEKSKEVNKSLIADSI